MPVFLYLSDKNHGSTVLEKFEKAAQNYGLPSRVRGDCGNENFEVMRFMEALRGTNEVVSFLVDPAK